MKSHRYHRRQSGGDSYLLPPIPTSRTLPSPFSRGFLSVPTSYTYAGVIDEDSLCNNNDFENALVLPDVSEIIANGLPTRPSIAELLCKPCNETLAEPAKLPAIETNAGPTRKEHILRYVSFVSAAPFERRPPKYRQKQPIKRRQLLGPEECFRCQLRLDHMECQKHKFIRVNGSVRHSFWYIQNLIDAINQENLRRLNQVTNDGNARREEMLKIQQTHKRRVKIYIEKKDGTRESRYIFVTESEYKRLKRDYSFAQTILNLEEGDEMVDFKASKKRFVENDAGKMVKVTKDKNKSDDGKPEVGNSNPRKATRPRDDGNTNIGGEKKSKSANTTDCSSSDEDRIRRKERMDRRRRKSTTSVDNKGRHGRSRRQSEDLQTKNEDAISEESTESSSSESENGRRHRRNKKKRKEKKQKRKRGRKRGQHMGNVKERGGDDPSTVGEEETGGRKVRIVTEYYSSPSSLSDSSSGGRGRRSNKKKKKKNTDTKKAKRRESSDSDSFKWDVESRNNKKKKQKQQKKKKKKISIASSSSSSDDSSSKDEKENDEEETEDSSSSSSEEDSSSSTDTSSSSSSSSSSFSESSSSEESSSSSSSSSSTESSTEVSDVTSSSVDSSELSDDDDDDVNLGMSKKAKIELKEEKRRKKRAEKKVAKREEKATLKKTEKKIKRINEKKMKLEKKLENETKRKEKKEKKKEKKLQKKESKRKEKEKLKEKNDNEDERVRKNDKKLKTNADGEEEEAKEAESVGSSTDAISSASSVSSVATEDLSEPDQVLMQGEETAAIKKEKKEKAKQIKKQKKTEMKIVKKDEMKKERKKEKKERKRKKEKEKIKKKIAKEMERVSVSPVSSVRSSDVTSSEGEVDEEMTQEEKQKRKKEKKKILKQKKKRMKKLQVAMKLVMKKRKKKGKSDPFSESEDSGSMEEDGKTMVNYDKGASRGLTDPIEKSDPRGEEWETDWKFVKKDKKKQKKHKKEKEEKKERTLEDILRDLDAAIAPEPKPKTNRFKFFIEQNLDVLREGSLTDFGGLPVTAEEDETGSNQGREAVQTSAQDEDDSLENKPEEDDDKETVATSNLSDDQDDLSKVKGSRKINRAFRKRATELLPHLEKVLRSAEELQHDELKALSKVKDNIAPIIDEKIDTIDYLAHFRLVEQAKLDPFGRAFVVGDENFDCSLSFDELQEALDGVPSLVNIKPKQIKYVLKVLNLDEHSIVSFKMFSVVAAICERMCSMDPFDKQLVDKSDLMDIERKMELYKAMFYCNIDPERSSNFIPADALRIELKAGGLNQWQEEYVLSRMSTDSNEISFFDYMAYIPLFLSMHENIIENPLNRDEKYNEPTNTQQRDMIPLGYPLSRSYLQQAKQRMFGDRIAKLTKDKDVQNTAEVKAITDDQDEEVKKL